MAAMLRSIFTMSAATALSRLTGFVRTMVQAAAVGTGTVVAEAYTVSNTLPNQIYELFMGGLLSSIFIPLLVERLSRHGEEDARRLTGALLNLIVPSLAAVAALGIVFAGPIIRLATDWTGSGNLPPERARETTELAVLLFRVFALQIVFYGIGALATGVLNAHRRFFLPTFAPVLNNLAVIASFAGYAALAPHRPLAAVYLLAAGTTLGVAAMSLVLVPQALRLGYRPQPVAWHPSLLPAARLAGPMLVFVAAAVGVQAAANFFGSAFSGASDLWYAFMIFQLPYGVFAVAIATALVPELAERHARGDAAGFREDLSFGLRTMAFIMVPAAVGMVALSHPIVGLLYERGGFDPADTEEVSGLLAAYGLGLLGYAGYFILVRAFYARQNTRTPAALNVVLLLLYVALAHLLSSALGLAGVALAFSASYTALALALLAAMRREVKRVDGARMARSLLRILAAGAVMYAAARGVLLATGTGESLAERALALALGGGLSLAAYLAAAYALRVEELRSAVALLRHRSVRAAR
ncbi:murein biosynthesis integral membrane protein MurJ [Rubrobacter xylanophilus]|nr:murein biosynthesis integral membrane protein MurJ [Rubrobacter xylanophilus]